MSKVALITGVTGQDGSYLQNSFWKKGTKYTVLSVALHHSTPNVWTTSIRIRIQAIPNFICTMAI